MSPGMSYLIVNVPIFLAGWVYISRRFFFYSLYGVAALSLSIDPDAFIITENTFNVLGRGFSKRKVY